MKTNLCAYYDRISFIIFCISSLILLLSLFTHNYFGYGITIVSFIIMFTALTLRLLMFAEDDEEDEGYDEYNEYDEYYEEEYPDNDFKDDNYPT